MILTIEDVIEEVKTNISNLEMSNHSIEDKLQLDSEKIKLLALESYGSKRMKFNTDYKKVHNIINRLEVTGGHCPCIPETEYNEDTECPCEDMDKKKECHCTLFN